MLLLLVLAANGCETCHASEHAGWASSRHATAATNPLYLASFELHQRRAWCTGCHESVGCSACHTEEVDHAVKHDPQLTDSKRCARCHDFDVPEHFGVGTGPMQNTYDEWRASKAAREGKACTACHDHRARGGHDGAWLAEILRVEVRRTADGIRATLAAPGAGHAVPTGDPFRFLALRIGGAAKRVVVPADGKLELRFPPSDATTWQLTYSHAEIEVKAEDHPLLVTSGRIE